MDKGEDFEHNNTTENSKHCSKHWACKKNLSGKYQKIQLRSNHDYCTPISILLIIISCDYKQNHDSMHQFFLTTLHTVNWLFLWSNEQNRFSMLYLFCLYIISFLSFYVLMNSLMNVWNEHLINLLRVSTDERNINKRKSLWRLCKKKISCKR